MRHSPSLRVLLSTLPAMALAAALPLRAATQRRLQVVTYDIVPYGMLDEQGQLGGEFVDITNRLAVQTGIAFDNRLLPYPRAVATIEHGQSDLVVGLVTATLQRIAHQVAPVAYSDIVVIGRIGARFDSLLELHGKTVGYMRGASFDDDFQRDELIRKYETSSMPQTIQMLLAGRLDAIIGTGIAVSYALKQMGLSDDALGAPLLIKRSLHWLHYSRKRYDNVTATLLKNGVERLRAQGFLDEVALRYAPLPERR